MIAYASRGLSKSEKNFLTHKLEYLALKWPICEKFSDYLYGTDFTVQTDNNPLTYVLTSSKLDAAGHRWLAALSTYRFNIKYRAGHTNRNADGLSRRPQAPLHTGEGEDWGDGKAHFRGGRKRGPHRCNLCTLSSSYSHLAATSCSCRVTRHKCFVSA